MNKIYYKGYPAYLSYKYQGKTVYHEISYADEYDYLQFKCPKNCILLRLDNNGLYHPIVAVNLDKSLIYFLEDYNNEDSRFETRGIKLDFPLDHILTPLTEDK